MSTPPRNTPQNWDGFFARTQNLPESKRTKPFLELIPLNGRVLDFGCGTGRWAAAFMRDRPDLIIDVVDQHLDMASLISADWKGDKFHTDFNNFKPTKTYDGIWAFATLFFLPRKAMEQKIHALADALPPKGIMQFTMVDDCHAATIAKFTGMSRDDIKSMLTRENLKPLSIELNKNAEYGPSKRKIPTFHITAQKVG